MTVTTAPEAATLDPLNADRLLRIGRKVSQIDEAKRRVLELMDECDDLVVEAVENGVRYSDVAAAAGRSVNWAQLSLKRKGYDGARALRK